MGTLDDLGFKYGTDKSSKVRKGHGYLDIYEKYFFQYRDVHMSFLEIGIFNGASLNMWEEYFQNSKIYAIDIDKNKMQNHGRIMSFVANQEKREDLLNVIQKIGKCDIIIDDGGHSMLQQQLTLGVLFPFVKSGGIYCIEDLHTSYMKKRRGFNKDGTIQTTLKMLYEVSKTGKVNSDYMSGCEKKYLEDNLELCEVVMAKQSEIAFLKHK